MFIFQDFMKVLLKQIKIEENDDNLISYLNQFKINKISNYFNWKENFFEYSMESDIFKKYYEKLMINFKDDCWGIYFKKNTDNISYFLNKYFNYCNNLIQNHSIFFSLIPGYIHMLIKFENIFRNIKYWDLKINENTMYNIDLNIAIIFFIPKILEKTYIYNDNDVIICFDIIENLFKLILKSEIIFPYLFSWEFLINSLDKILKTQNFFFINRVLIFLYNCFSQFDIYLIKRIWIIIKEKYFNWLFFHWSDLIRNSFHHWICYKIFKTENLTIKNNFIMKNKQNVLNLIVIEINKLIKEIKEEYNNYLNYRIKNKNKKIMSLRDKINLKKKLKLKKINKYQNQYINKFKVNNNYLLISFNSFKEIKKNSKYSNNVPYLDSRFIDDEATCIPKIKKNIYFK